MTSARLLAAQVTLAPIDYVIIGVPLVLVIAIALAMRPYMKSVADFLAANRCAGRYLICTSVGPMGSAVMGLVISLEVFSHTGFSIGMWQNFTGVIMFMFTLFGLITFRFRETRCLTFHQFFEVRYSKGMRVFSSIASLVSGIVGFGLVPAVGARFFVYFCGMPESLAIAGWAVPTFAVIMVVLMALSLFFALTGGQISVMVTDCVEGLISSILYLVIAFFILVSVTGSQMKTTLLSGPPGASYINPFDISGRADFDGWYVVFALIFNLYMFRGGAAQQGFNAAAKTAHEGKMAGILSFWRGFGSSAMVTLAGVAALAVLHHPDFAGRRELAMEALKNVGSPQLQTQMEMPMALAVLFAPGIKGAFCAIGLFGLLSSQGVALHGLGSTFLQDVVLPLRKKAFSTKAHLLALRWAAVGVGIVVCVISLLYKPADYLMMLTTLIGAIYLGGVGAVVWGGLYWKKGTTAGAWAAMITGTSLAVLGNVAEHFWVSLQPILVHWAGSGHVSKFLLAHPDRCPFNGQTISTVTALCAMVLYVIVSLLTCKADFDMDRMLHRGKYAIGSEDDTVAPLRRGFSWGKLIGIDEHYSRSDKVVASVTFWYSIAWKVCSISIILCWLFVTKPSDNWWFGFTMVGSVWIPLVMAVITTIWLTIGTIRDMSDLVKNLRVIGRNQADDGTVRNHHNAGDPETETNGVSPAEGATSHSEIAV